MKIKGCERQRERFNKLCPTILQNPDSLPYFCCDIAPTYDFVQLKPIDY